jgi:hypothetical protein
VDRNEAARETRKADDRVLGEFLLLQTRANRKRVYYTVEPVVGTVAVHGV